MIPVQVGPGPMVRHVAEPGGAGWIWGSMFQTSKRKNNYDDGQNHWVLGCFGMFWDVSSFTAMWVRPGGSHISGMSSGRSAVNASVLGRWEGEYGIGLRNSLIVVLYQSLAAGYQIIFWPKFDTWYCKHLQTVSILAWHALNHWEIVHVESVRLLCFKASKACLVAPGVVSCVFWATPQSTRGMHLPCFNCINVGSLSWAKWCHGMETTPVAYSNTGGVDTRYISAGSGLHE